MFVSHFQSRTVYKYHFFGAQTRNGELEDYEDQLVEFDKKYMGLESWTHIHIPIFSLIKFSFSFTFSSGK